MPSPQNPFFSDSELPARLLVLAGGGTLGGVPEALLLRPARSQAQAWKRGQRLVRVD